MRSESTFVEDWCVFEDSEPSWNDSTNFGLDFVVAATPVASPRRRVRRASLASSLSQEIDLSESSVGCVSVKSEQLKSSSSKTSPRSPRRLAQRPASSSRSSNPPRTPAKKSTRRRGSVSMSNEDKLCNTMASCSLIDLMKVNHINLDTASSSSGSTPTPTEHSNSSSPRRRPVEESNVHSSPRRLSPRRTRRLVSMPQVGSAKPALQTTENACTRRMARRMSCQA